MRGGLGFLALVGLSACGGGSSTGPVTETAPIAGSGFAQTGDQIEIGQTFSTMKNSTIRIIEGTPSAGEVDISVTLIDNDSLSLTIDGKTATLTRTPGSDDPFTADIGQLRFFLVGLGSNYSNADAIYTQVYDGGLDEFVGGWSHLGFNSSAETLGLRTGLATYSGAAFASARASGYFDSFGSGSANFTVNFDSNTIQGQVELSDRGSASSEFEFPSLLIAFPETQFTGNTFNPDVTVQFTGANSSNGVVDSASLQGQFYGSTAQTVAGNFIGSGSSDVFDDIMVQGGFTAGID
ncbi:MAG: transferrin-binding protein-like solute binding protein [Pseudomonadota bacterium]